MRIHIEIDDRLINKALKLSGLPTKRAAVEAGLKLLIHTQEHPVVGELFGAIPIDHDLNSSRQRRRF